MGPGPAAVVRAAYPEEPGGSGEVAGGGALPRGAPGPGRAPGGSEETPEVLQEEDLGGSSILPSAVS